MIELKYRAGQIVTIVLIVLSIVSHFYKGDKFSTAIGLILVITGMFGFLFIFKDVPALFYAIKENIHTYGDSKSIIRPLGYTVLDCLIMFFTWYALNEKRRNQPELYENKDPDYD